MLLADVKKVFSERFPSSLGLGELEKRLYYLSTFITINKLLR